MRKKRLIILSIPLLLFSVLALQAQPAKTTGEAQVIFRGETLFSVYASIGPFSAQERARAITERLEKVYKDKKLSAGTVTFDSKDQAIHISIGPMRIMSITEEDAKATGKAREVLSEEYAAKLRSILTPRDKKFDIREFFYDNKKLITNLGITLILIAFIILALILLAKLFKRLYLKIAGLKGTVLRSIRFRSYEIISDETITATVIALFKGIRLAITLAIFYYFVNVEFTLFPWTRSPVVINILKGILLTILTAVIAIGIYKLIKKAIEIFRDNIPKWKDTIIKPIKIKTIEVLSAERIVEISQQLLRGFQILINLVILYIFIPIVFSFFDFTRTWADTLFGYILKPLKIMITTFISYLPNLFFIIVIIFVNRYLIKFAKLIFQEIERGKIYLPRFHRDWAEPTYKIVRFLIIVFSVIVIFPYIPGSQSEAFKGISIFLGVLFSLGSTSVIANVVAGIILTYMYAFTIGDRVKIGDTTGDIIERTLLVTRVRTTKNVVITIPNSSVLNSHIINFSSLAGEKGLILHTTVTIGYDVPWKRVHEALIAAARATGDILPEPDPFVLQTSLNDYYVSYEVNAYTNKPNGMARIYSDLHQNIQDAFNEAGIEILSPQYAAIRDGNYSTIPEDYLPKSYEAPGFRLFPLNKLFNKSDDRKK